MEINITSLLEADLFPFSHSRAEGGQNAGRDTWNASKQDASERQPPFIGTDEEKDAFRDYVQSTGGWEREEIEAWNETELNALFLQMVAGDVRQCPAVDGGRADSIEDIEWQEYEIQASAGSIPSNLFKAEDGQIYYSISN